MPELLSPAGSAEGVSAAVQSGADAVYVSLRGISGGGPLGLTEDEFGRAAEFARVRGVRIYALIDVPPFDEDFSAAVENARRASRMGADAVIANDVGLIWAIRRAVPSLPIHAGDKLNVHNLDGVKLYAAMGVKRVSVSRELPRAELERLCKASPIEIEVPVHGPTCAAYGGQCLLPALAGRENCREKPCVTGFIPDTRGRHPLAMKDTCLIGHLDFLKSCGVAAVRIDGRERRPEYTAAVTGVYSRVLGTGRDVSADDTQILSDAFPSGGFTDVYLTGRDFADALGVPGQEPTEDTPFYNTIRRGYLNHEFQRVPVVFTASLMLHEPLRLTVTDDRGNTASGEGGSPELAFHQETTATVMQTELYKTGGTPFTCQEVHSRIEKGIYLNPQEIGTLRDELLRQLMGKRVYLEPRAENVVDALPRATGPTEPPVLTVSVRTCAQLSPRLLALAPPVLYIPLEEAVSGAPALEPFLSSKDISVCAALPPVLYDSELGRVTELLIKARQLGINEVLAGHMGHVIFARQLGFTVRGDTSLNLKNGPSLAVMRGLRLKSAALSMELSAARVRGISKYLDTELVVYGRMPLMHTAGCLIQAQTGV